MPRTIGLVAILVCAVAAVFGGAWAQQPAPQWVELPRCDEAVVEETLTAGRIPQFRGCGYDYALQRIRQQFGNAFEINRREMVAVNLRPGTVIRQGQDGRIIYFYVSKLASQPPSPEAPPPPPFPAATGATFAVTPIAPPPPAVPERVSFSIANAASAEEGKPLTFRISRSGDDGRGHEVRLSYDKNPSLLVNPPQSIRFEPGEPAQKDLVLQTAPGLPGDGEHEIEVRISPADDGATIGGPRSATGTITDAPLPAPAVATYRLEADSNARREQGVSFTLSRTGPLAPAPVPYRVEQDGYGLATGAPLQANFREGEPSTRIVIPAGQFAPCGGPLTVKLSQPDGTEISATAEFSEPPQDWCGPRPKRPWWDIIIDTLGPNLALVLGGIALVGGIIAHHILPKPTIDVEPSLEIESGAASFHPREEPVSRWPKFSADVAIEQGELRVTQPLPKLEPDDG